jgi:hypothetical protein
MYYTIQFNLFVDDDKAWTDEEMGEFLYEGLDSTSISVENVKIISAEN